MDHLLAGYDPGVYGYSLTEMPPGDPAMVLDLGYAGEAGGDYVDAPRLRFLDRVPGVRQVGEKRLAIA